MPQSPAHAEGQVTTISITTAQLELVHRCLDRCLVLDEDEFPLTPQEHDDITTLAQMSMEVIRDPGPREMIHGFAL